MKLAYLTLAAILATSCTHKSNENAHQIDNHQTNFHQIMHDSLDVEIYNILKAGMVKTVVPYKDIALPFSKIFVRYENTTPESRRIGNAVASDNDRYIYKGDLVTDGREEDMVRLQIGGFSLENKIYNVDEEVPYVRSTNTPYDFFIKGSFYIAVNRETKNVDFIAYHVLKINENIVLFKHDSLRYYSSILKENHGFSDYKIYIETLFGPYQKNIEKVYKK